MTADLRAQLAEALGRQFAETMQHFLDQTDEFSEFASAEWCIVRSVEMTLREHVTPKLAAELAALVSAHVAQVREGLADEIEAVRVVETWEPAQDYRNGLLDLADIIEDLTELPLSWDFFLEPDAALEDVARLVADREERARRPIDWNDVEGWGRGENVHESATGSELEAEEADE